MFLKISIVALICLLCCGCIFVHAVNDYFSWNKDIAIYLPASNTNVCFDKTTHFESFLWDDMNATSVTFYVIGTGSSSLDYLTVSNTAGNITFLNVMESNELVYSSSTGTSTSLTIPSKPRTVTINGLAYAEGTNWTWSLITNTLTTSVTSASTIVLSWGSVIDFFTGMIFIAVGIASFAGVIIVVGMIIVVIRTGRIEIVDTTHAIILVVILALGLGIVIIVISAMRNII